MSSFPPCVLQALKTAGVSEVVLAINYQPEVRACSRSLRAATLGLQQVLARCNSGLAAGRKHVAFLLEQDIKKMLLRFL